MPFVFLIIKFGVELPIFDPGKIDVTIINFTELRQNGNALISKDNLTSKTTSKRILLSKSFKKDVIPFIDCRYSSGKNIQFLQQTLNWNCLLKYLVDSGGYLYPFHYFCKPNTKRWYYPTH